MSDQSWGSGMVTQHEHTVDEILSADYFLKHSPNSFFHDFRNLGFLLWWDFHSKGNGENGEYKELANSERFGTSNRQCPINESC